MDPTRLAAELEETLSVGSRKELRIVQDIEATSVLRSVYRAEGHSIIRPGGSHVDSQCIVV